MLCPFPLAKVGPAFEPFDFGTKQGSRSKISPPWFVCPKVCLARHCTHCDKILLSLLPAIFAAPALLCLIFLCYALLYLTFEKPTTRMRTAARPAQGRPAITNLKHKTGGQQAPSAVPYLSLRVANPLSSCSCERTWAPGSTCTGRVPGGDPPARYWTVHVHYCSTLTARVPGGRPGAVPRDHQSHTDRLGLTEYSVSNQAQACLPSTGLSGLGYPHLQIHRPRLGTIYPMGMLASASLRSEAASPSSLLDCNKV